MAVAAERRIKRAEYPVITNSTMGIEFSLEAGANGGAKAQRTKQNQ
jgi:hypothetical protein